MISAIFFLLSLLITIVFFRAAPKNPSWEEYKTINDWK